MRGTVHAVRHVNALAFVLTDCDAGHRECTERRYAGAPDIQSRCPYPRLALRGHDAWPGGLVQRAGHALRPQGVVCGEYGSRRRERSAPVHEARKTVTGEDQRERHISSRLLSINSGEFRSIGGGAMELFDE